MLRAFSVFAMTLLVASLAWAATVSGPAPNFTLQSNAGGQVSLASLKGKVVMVNFWATSCATCVKEMPQMVETYNKFKQDGLEFVAVAMSYDPPNYVLNYTETRKLPFKVALDSGGDLAKQFGDVNMTPTTFVIGGWQDPQALPGRAGFCIAARAAAEVPEILTVPAHR